MGAREDSIFILGQIKYTCFGISVIRIVGVYHAGGHRPQEIDLEEALFLTDMKNTCNICNVQLKGSTSITASLSSVCLLYSIMHERTGVHFVLAGVKQGTTGSD